LHLDGANPNPQSAGEDLLPGTSNYLQGNDPRQWQTNVPEYGRVEYEDVYPGIAAAYYGNQGQLEYDFVVAPGADPSAIALRIQGAQGLELDGQGNLVIHASGGDVVEQAPVVYQEVNGVRVPVQGQYVLEDGQRVGFQIGTYDRALPLVIDPVLAYSTYFGGTGNDEGRGIAVDPQGNVYVTGITDSSDFPQINGGGLQKSFQGIGTDAYVVKLDPTGRPVYFTYLGGSSMPGGPLGTLSPEDFANAIAVDAAGEVYLAGETDQSTLNLPFPLKNSAATPQNGSNVFVAKLMADGSDLVFSTYLTVTRAGTATNLLQEYGTGIAVDSVGNAYVTGVSYVTGGVNYHALLAKLSPGGTTLFSQDYGGDGDTFSNGIALDTAGNAYIAGSTTSSSFATQTPAQVTTVGASAAFVLKVNPDPTVAQPIYSVRFGGSKGDGAGAIAVDAAGDAYITGSTTSPDFPTTANAFQKIQQNGTITLPLFPGGPNTTATGTVDAFVTKLDPTGQKLIYSTYLGGNGDDVGNAIAVDPAGDAVVVGQTNSSNFPTANPLHIPGGLGDQFGGGQYDAFVAKLDPSGQSLLYSTYLGGGTHVFYQELFNNGIDYGKDVANSVALDSQGSAYVTGYTGSTDFPTAGNPFELLFGNGASQPQSSGATRDAFIAKLAPPLTVIAQPVHAVSQKLVPNPVATFTTPDFGAPASNFKATIDWGDGNDVTDGTIVAPATGSNVYQVDGFHVYASPGAFPIVVTVTDVKNNVTAATVSNVSSLKGNQSEPSIAVDPTNPLHLFAVSNDEQRGLLDPNATVQKSGLFAAYSLDGGVTWLPSDPTDHLIAQGSDLPGGFSDPRAAFDQFGNLFISYVASDLNTVVVALSIDGGKTFTQVGALQPEGVVGNRIAVDQPSLATGPGGTVSPGSVWVMFLDVVKQQLVAYSATVTDKGKVGAFAATPQLIPGAAGNFGDIAVGPNGTVMATWESLTTLDGTGQAAPGPENIMVSIDTDGPGPATATSKGFGPAQVATSTNYGLEALLPAANSQIGSRTIAANPRLAWDRSGGPHNARLYLVYTDAPSPGSTKTDIRLLWSDNAGATWNGPVPVDTANLQDVNASPVFEPSVAVDQTNGDVAVGWYDTNDDPQGVKTEFWVAVSSDGGVSFPHTQLVSSGQSNAADSNLSAFGANYQYGDYTGVAFANGMLYPVWADNSSELGNNPDLPQFDIAAARVAVASVTPPPPTLTAVPIGGIEGQNLPGVVALINDSDPKATAGQFTARISWGDGQTSGVDSITQPGGPGTPFQVLGHHTYTEEGTFIVGVTVFDAASDTFATLNGFAIQSAPDKNSAAIAVDPSNAEHLFAISNTGDAPGLAVAVSQDGGGTWSQFNPNDAKIADGTDGLPPALGFAHAAFDANGNLFLTYLGQDKISFVLAELPAGGTTFTTKLNATVQGATAGTLAVGVPALAVGPAGAAGSTVWIAEKNQVKDVIQAARPGASAYDVISGSTGARSRIALTTGPDGQVLLAFQVPTTDPGVDNIMTSLNPGGTAGGFQTSVPAGTTAVTGFYEVPAQNVNDITANLGLAYDRSPGPHHGRAYLIYTDLTIGGGTAVYLRYLDPAAAAWSDPPVLVSSGSAGAYAFLPSIAVDQITGDVAVTWYDTSADPAGKKTEFVAAISGNGGQTFSRPLVLDQGPSDATVTGLSSFGSTLQYGAYTGLDFAGGILYPLWADDGQSLLINSGTNPHFDLAAGHFGVARIADAPLTVTAQNFKATRGTVFNGAIGSFTDGDPNDGFKLYTVIVNWGGMTSTVGDGTITVQGGNGSFTVTGTHTYTDDKPFPITLAVADLGGSKGQATATATVVEPAPTLASSQPTLNKLVFAKKPTGEVNVAEFLAQPDPDPEPNPFSAQIDWGDGTPAVAGSISVSIKSSGVQDVIVSGNHTYAQAGLFHPQVTLTVDGTSSATASRTIEVLKEVTEYLKYASSGLIFNPQTQLFNGSIALTNTSSTTITGPEPVVIDGLSSGVNVADASGVTGSGAPYLIDPAPTLAPGQTSNVPVQFADPSQAPLTYTLQVYDPPPDPTQQTVDAPLTATAANVSAVEGQPFQGLVATFTDADPNGQLGDYSATINWGDGVTSAGVITADPTIPGQFDVSGGHTYADEKSLAVTVTISDLGSSSATTPSPVQLVSVADPSLISASANGFSSQPSMSADGRFVAFVSTANNLVGSGPLGMPSPGTQVYVRDRQTGTTTLVSVAQAGQGFGNSPSSPPGEGDAHDPVISPNGRYVAFDSTDANLVSQDTHETDQIYVRDLQQGTTSLVSVDTTGTQGAIPQADLSSGPAQRFSADGRFFVFTTSATNLVANDQVGGNQLFVRDLQAGTTTLVSVNVAGTDGGNAPTPGYSNTYYDPTISADGRYVAFQSASTNLVANDAVGGTQVFVHDLQQNVTTLVSVDRGGNDGGNDFVLPGTPSHVNDDNESPLISADGRMVLFQSGATNLLPQDTLANTQNLFARDLQKGTTSLVNIDPSGAVIPAGTPLSEGFPAGFPASLSADGTRIAFLPTLGSGFDTTTEVLVRDLSAGTTTLASVNLAGTGNTSGYVSDPVLSGDGRYVTFLGGKASDLVANDAISNAATVSNPLGSLQLFQRDLQKGVTTLVSANQANTDGADNTHGEGQSGPPLVDFDRLAISDDGRFVGFASNADNLVANDYNVEPDVFVRDTQAQTTDLISVRAAALPDPFGPPTTFFSYQSSQESVSADGRYIAFASARPDLISPFHWPLKYGVGSNVYVRDLQTGTTTLASINSSGNGPGNAPSSFPIISGDGRFVLFESGATDLGPTNTNGATQLYWRDLQLGITRLVTVSASGDGSSGTLSENYSLSADGRFVLFVLNATDLVPAYEELYVRDMQTGTTTMVSVTPDGTARGNGSVNAAEISDDGQFVVFGDTATNLTPGVSSQSENIYVRDLQKGTTSLVSINQAGTGEGNAESFLAPHSLSSDGRFLAFVSEATDLVGPDQKGAAMAGNLFVRDLQTGTTSLASVSGNGNSGSGGQYGVFPNATMSGNGRYVAFESSAPNLVPGITTSGDNVFVRDLQTGITVLASVNTAGGGTDIANDSSNPPLLSDDGRYLIFTAGATDLVAGDAAGKGVQVYLRDLQKATTVLVSHNLAGTGGGDADVLGQANQQLLDQFPLISGNGATITFVTEADDLLAHDFAIGNPNVYAVNNAPTVSDAGGGTASALATVTKNPTAGAVSFPVVLDTSALMGTNGALAFQFNPGALPDAQAAAVSVSSFAGGQLTGNPMFKGGGASGSLANMLQLQNTATLNEVTQPFTFGSGISFDVTFTGAALSQPGNGLFGSTFAVQLLTADGQTTQLSADPSGAVSAHDLAPNGTVTGRVFDSVSGGKPAAALPLVTDAPITAAAAPIQAVVGQPFSGLVATFSDTALSGNIADFTATITWDDGTTSPATIAADPQVAHQLDVMGTHTFQSVGAPMIGVAILDVGGARADLQSPATVAAPAEVHVSGVAINGFEYSPLENVIVAQIAGGGQPASAFTATIDWGDMTTTAGTVVNSTGGYSVQGSHTYVDEGSYSATVTVVNGTTSATAQIGVTMLEELLADGTRGTANQRFISEVYRDLLHRQAEMAGLLYWNRFLDRGDSLAQVVQLIESSPTLEYRRIQVQDLCGQLLHRPATAQELTDWSAFLQDGGTVGQLAGMIVVLPEYAQATSQDSGGFLRALYRDALGRDADASGMQYWQTLATPDNRAQIAEMFFASDEYRQNLVQNFYHEYLHRPGEPVGVAYWFAHFQRGDGDDAILAAFIGDMAFTEFFHKTSA
jgi:hypothetical protein